MSDGERKVDYFIVGQGLAGTLLARALLARGRSVVVADSENPAAASRIAAGLISPITGRKLVPTWRGDLLLPFARRFYRNWEAELRARFYWEKPIWRFFGSKRERDIWQEKRALPAFAEQTEELPGDVSSRFSLQPDLSGFVLKRGAHVDTRLLLWLFREQLRERHALVEAAFSFADLQVLADGVRWRNLQARKAIFCEGHAASRNPFFSWIPFSHAKGEVLTVEAAALPEGAILNRGKWLLPVGNGRFRAGATYDGKDLTEEPTAAGRQAIRDGIARLVSVEPQVVAHEAGIRPIVTDMRPVVGLHPGKPQLGILNGLGSKGVLWGPFFAEQLAESLENGSPLDPEIDVRRNL